MSYIDVYVLINYYHHHSKSFVIICALFNECIKIESFFFSIQCDRDLSIYFLCATKAHCQTYKWLLSIITLPREAYAFHHCMVFKRKYDGPFDLQNLALLNHFHFSFHLFDSMLFTIAAVKIFPLYDCSFPHV